MIRAAILYGLYFSPIVIGGALLIRSLYNSGTAMTEVPAESFTCASVGRQLEDEAWLFYDGELRQIGIREPSSAEVNTNDLPCAVSCESGAENA